MQLRSFWRLSDKSRCFAVIGLALCVGTACKPNDQPATVAQVPTTAPDYSALRPLVTVSGVSAGGYMAVQTHVALSDRIGGVAVIAGGPYHCADGSLNNALANCMSGGAIDLMPLLAYTREAALNGNIAPVDSMLDANIWLFRSPRDAIVSQEVAQALTDYYREMAPSGRIAFVNNVEAAHGWPTVSEGAACGEIAGDFVNACDFDAAGKLLNHLYAGLRLAASEPLTGELIDADLSAFIEAGSNMSDNGFVFVPDGCRATASSCRLHIVFHGCRQGAEFIENRLATSTGLNAWADSNRIVVVYPQVESSLTNPQGCWDWWGYSGPDYDQASGKQIATIAAIIDAWSVDNLYPLAGR